MSDISDIDAVEVEPLEELDEEAYIDSSDSDLITVIDPESIDGWSAYENIIKNYKYSFIPIITMDSRFKINYFNDAFQNHIVKGDNYAGYSFFQIVDPFEKAQDTIQIHQSLKSIKTGFSWKGRVKFSHQSHLNIDANALISPIFNDEKTNSPPLGYLCIFDDVTEENQTILHNTFLSLLEASKLKDNDTGFHIKRVGEYSRLMSKYLFSKQTHPEIDAQFIENITFLAPMHDVGKIGTPDDILHKPGSLLDWEWDIMREHTINGGFILGSYPSAMANQIPLFHHEKWDGSGYPYEFSEEMIPLSARIVAIADVYDALRMKRSYKEGFTHQKACGIIEEGSGAHFDPELVKAFFELEHRFDDTYNMLADV